MPGHAKDSYTDLVTCFFEECEREFRFLEFQHGFKYLSGIVSKKNGCEIITPYQNQTVNSIFWLTTRYERENITLEIKYGDSDFSIEPYLHYERIQRLEWDEILWITKNIKGEFFPSRRSPQQQKSEALLNIWGKWPEII